MYPHDALRPAMLIYKDLLSVRRTVEACVKEETGPQVKQAKASALAQEGSLRIGREIGRPRKK